MSTCYGTNGFPIPCQGWTVYDSYVTDPLYQKYFTLGWTCSFALCFLLTLPKIVRSGMGLRFRGGVDVRDWFGVRGDQLREGAYASLSSPTSPSPSKHRNKRSSLTLFLLELRSLLSLSHLTPRLPFSPSRNPSCNPYRPHFPFSLSTLLITLLLPTLYLLTLLPESQLRANPNRFGFLALASIPPLFVLAAKNGPVQILLGKGWEKVSWLHRWMGRCVLLLVLLHFYFWTIQWVSSHQVTVFLSGTKERRGLGALISLLLLALSSSRPVRAYSYTLFFTLHYLTLLIFLIFLNRHTVYAKGWATYTVVGIYTYDIAMRVISWRWRVVELRAGEGGMTSIKIDGMDSGWRGGQHVQIRLFFIPVSNSLWSLFRSFESHPFSITSAPPSRSVLRTSSISLSARSCGLNTWTHDLHSYARLYSSYSDKVRVIGMIEGPYGGVDAFESLEEEGMETVLMVAGGSGMSYVCGVLDEVVGRRKRGRGGGKVVVVWAVRERAHIQWFAESLRKIIEEGNKISGLSVTLKIYITCDPLLTSATSNSLSTTSSSSLTPSPPLPHTQHFYSRPPLSTLLGTFVQDTLSPCSNCWPVCKCGGEGEGAECPNDEEKCCGASQEEEEGFDTVPELNSGGSGGGCCGGKKETDDDITVIGSIDNGPSCCSSKPSTNKAKDMEASSLTKEKDEGVVPSSCCAGTGTGCCSGGVEGRAEDDPLGPLKIRTGGLSVFVCGPGEMIAEMRNAVARVPISKQARIGGITLHTESFHA